MTAFNAPNDTGETDVSVSEGAELLRVRKENADAKMDRAFRKSVHLLLPGSVGHERHAFGLILAEKANSRSPGWCASPACLGQGGSQRPPGRPDYCSGD